MRGIDLPSDLLSNHLSDYIMKKKNLLIVSGLLFSSFALTSCDTATGQGAGWGAATGAVLGAAATGNVRGAAVGALIGANTGAIIGASIDEDQAVRNGPRPRWISLRPQNRHARVLPEPVSAVPDLQPAWGPHGGLVEDRVGGGYFRKP
jgi:predicted small secreted protein